MVLNYSELDIERVWSLIVIINVNISTLSVIVESTNEQL